MKVVLAFPCHRRHIGDPSFGLLPVGLLSLAASLRRAGHGVVVAHLARFGAKDAVRLIAAEAPEVVGISCFTFNRHLVTELARRLREGASGKPPYIVVGGPHATPLAAELLSRAPAVDAVATGESEATMVELLGRLASGDDPAGLPGLVVRGPEGPVAGPPRPLMETLDDLPSLAEDETVMLGVDRLFQRRHLTTARGCSARCRFCCSPLLWDGRVRRHSVDRILAEVATLRRRFGLTHLSFRDDTFTTDRAWTLEFCTRLAAEHPSLLWDCQSRVTALDPEVADAMARAGCIQIQLGVESGSDAILKSLGKPFTVARAREAIAAVRAAGVAVSLYLIAGVPGETEADLRATEDLVREVRPSSLSVSRLALFPGTPLAEDVPPARWFRDEGENLLVRDDPDAVAAEARLQALADEIAGDEPFTPDELGDAARRLGGAVAPTLMRGQLLERLGDPDAAASAYRAVLNLQPDNPWAELYLGEMALDEGNAVGARRHLQRAVDLAPGWPYPLDRLGWALIMAGRERDGRARLAEAAALEPFAEPPPPPAAVSDEN